MTFVDTDVLIDVARRVPRAIGFWRRAEARSTMACSVISVFEILAGCRNLAEQRACLRDLASIRVVHVESGDSAQALAWFRSLHLARGVGFLDCLIAAAARRLAGPIHTRNARHFRTLPGLRVVQPY